MALVESCSIAFVPNAVWHFAAEVMSRTVWNKQQGNNMIYRQQTTDIHVVHMENSNTHTDIQIELMRRGFKIQVSSSSSSS